MKEKKTLLIAFITTTNSVWFCLQIAVCVNIKMLAVIEVNFLFCFLLFCPPVVLLGKN